MNACAKVGARSYNTDMLANSITVAVRQRPRCYSWEQQGHIKVTCPQKSTPLETFQRQRSTNVNCDRCGRSSHATKLCKPRFHVNEQFLKNQGN